MLFMQHESLVKSNIIVQGQTVFPPRARLFMTVFYSVCPITGNIFFRALDSPDHIGFFHLIDVNTHVLCHFLNILKSHGSPPHHRIPTKIPDLHLLFGNRHAILITT